MITIQADIPLPPEGYDPPVIKNCLAPRDALVWWQMPGEWKTAPRYDEPAHWLIAFKSKPWVPEHWAGREVFEVEEGKWPQHPPDTKVFFFTKDERKIQSYGRTLARSIDSHAVGHIAAYTLMQPGEEGLSL